MKIILNSKEEALISAEERERIVKLIQNQGFSDISLNDYKESKCSGDNDCFPFPFSRETLLNNLTELQIVSLSLEEQVHHLKERNEYLEGKVNWLRGKSGEDSFLSRKAKHCSTFSADSEITQSALVQVINKLESKGSQKIELSFTKSKRLKKDKALVSQSEYFDKFYVANELQKLGLKVNDTLDFFVSFGAELELSPSEKFDTKSYLAMNPDVKESGINPLLHYIKHGKAEGRVLI